MRFVLLCIAFLLAGCGSTNQASSPTVVPSPTATMKFHHAPRMTINSNHHYTSTLQTSEGNIVITLLPKVAPSAVNNFIFLARHHYYDNNIFHRILRGFIIQTGDPTGTGLGNPGYTFKSEPVPNSMYYTPGVVAMANTGQPNSNGSQFFIVVGSRARSLPRTYTIFGKVAQGMAAVTKIADTPVGPSVANPSEYSQPINAPVITHVTIHESG